MHAATAAGQRRPRLMRASVTEPSLFTSSANDHAHLSMAHSSQTCSSSSSAAGRSSSPAGSSSSSSSSSSYQRRATDLLNHVAYLSSCATSPVSSLISGTGTTSRSRGALSTMASLNSSSASHSHGATGTGTSSRATAHATSDACYHRRGGGGDSADEVFGSSPASTHTAASMEDLQARYPGSENYYSFPSFDTWDPDCEKEDDIDG